MPTRPLDPTSVTEWPPKPPLLLTAEQSDDLGTYIVRDANRLTEIGFEKLVEERRQRSDFHPDVKRLRHKAARLLNHLKERGASVTLSTPPWTDQQREDTLRRGPHKSADEFADFLREELLDFVKKGFWMVLPYRLLQKHKRLISNLRISPMGVVPQRARRPRIIVDYSFQGLNDETIKMAPREAMQFGKALERILQAIVDANPKHGPVQLIKVDIADGFYRIWLNVHDIPKLAVAIPTLYGDEPLLALPLVLPMGWTESPPYFCAATETVTDITNRRLANHWKPPPHRLEELADTQPEESLETETTVNTAAKCVPLAISTRPHNRRTRKRPLQKTDVFVDDFVAMAQGNKQQLSKVRRTLLHTLDEVLRKLDALDDEHRKEPASTKKLKQGDACWGTRKLVLGWIIDTILHTLELPQHRKDRLHAILEEVPRSQKRTSVKKWQQIVGEFRSMAIAIPGSRGLFSLLQEALRHQSNGRIRLSRGVHDTLDDLRWLANDLAIRPTRLYEIVPQPDPELLGAQDASGDGMGGVWFPASTSLVERPVPGSAVESSTADSTGPLLWRAKFDADITRDLVSYQNPSGTITNSDLELAASLVQHDIAAHGFDIRERTIASGSDNTPTVAWQSKGSTTTVSAPAYLLRLQALHQRFHRYYSSAFFVPGKLNAMADDYRILALSTPAARDAFLCDLRAAQAATRAGIVSSRATSNDNTWKIWADFCNDLLVDPWLTGNSDPILLLQVFAQRYRTGQLAPRGRPVKSRTVEGALRAVGQAFTGVGANDPRLTTRGTTEFRLGRQLRGYAKADPPPDRVKPVPISVVYHAANIAQQHGTAESLAVIHMLCIAFFFLCRPGEYTAPTADNAPFRLQDVTFYVGNRRVLAPTATDDDLARATFVTLTFTTQKNAVRGEVIGLGLSGDPFICPVRSTASRVQHLLHNNAPPTTPLCTYYLADRAHYVTPGDISETLKSSVRSLGPAIGFSHHDVSARSLRAAGAMALLCAHVDSDTIRLLGRWRSDAMLRYLTVQAQPIMRDFSARMLQGGQYTLLPNAAIPIL